MVAPQQVIRTNFLSFQGTIIQEIFGCRSWCQEIHLSWDSRKINYGIDVFVNSISTNISLMVKAEDFGIPIHACLLMMK